MVNQGRGLHVAERPGKTLSLIGSRVDVKEQERRFLKMGHAMARQAIKLPPHERLAFIRAEVAELQRMYQPLYRGKPSSPGKELLDSMEKWVMRIVRVLEQDA